MMKKYFVELRDNQHIVTAEKIDRDGEISEIKLLKPRDDDAFCVEGENYKAFWLWMKDEKSFLPEENLDICFLYPPELFPAQLIESAKYLNANIATETEINVGDVRSFLNFTGRSLEDSLTDEEKTLLHLANGDKLCATSRGGKGISAEPKNFSITKQEEISTHKYSVRKKSLMRPKSFVPIITPDKITQTQQSEKIVEEVQEITDNSLPRATATDIQIGIKQITKDQCQDVDFRN